MNEVPIKNKPQKLSQELFQTTKTLLTIFSSLLTAPEWNKSLTSHCGYWWNSSLLIFKTFLLAFDFFFLLPVFLPSKRYNFHSWPLVWPAEESYSSLFIAASLTHRAGDWKPDLVPIPKPKVGQSKVGLDNPEGLFQPFCDSMAVRHLHPCICSDSVVLFPPSLACKALVRWWFVSTLAHFNKFLPPSRGNNYMDTDSWACKRRFKTTPLALQGATAVQLSKQRGAAGRCVGFPSQVTPIQKDLSAKKLKK